MMTSLEISRARALVRFPGSRAAQEAARNEMEPKIGRNEVNSFFPVCERRPLATFDPLWILGTDERLGGRREAMPNPISQALPVPGSTRIFAGFKSL